ncbi:MAG: WxcM-like domain-containing protein [Candidatus Azambacteria bacterium]|nr:WxcM-like domain-containing protein [Candidatus Azambacteria bacterium]
MPQFYEYRTHSDYRRSGSYDIIPGTEGDFNFTVYNPNVIPEELHMHKKQTDYFAVAQGRVMFLLVYEDGREEKFILTKNDKKTLIIPPGIWHNYMALEPAVMVFYLSHKYDVSDEFKKKTDPSEWTLPKQ